MSARTALAVLAAALPCGLLTEAALVAVALVDPPRILESRQVFLVRGTAAWHGNERRSPLLRWVNMETVGPLVNSGGADSGDVPAWAEPAPPPDARLVRHAALGVGWPLPAIAGSWNADRSDVNFPPPVEAETSGDTPKEAARRLVGSIMHERAPAGGHGTIALIPSGIALDSLALALPWGAAIAAVRRIRRGSRVTRPG